MYVLYVGPTLIVVPATIMHQWMREFNNWYPNIRIFILHDSISSKTKSRNRTAIVNKCMKCGGVLITSYSVLRIEKDIILNKEWAYCILDEGHKIRVKHTCSHIFIICYFSFFHYFCLNFML